MSKSGKERRKTITMKAAVMRKFGDFDVLKYDDIETPRPKPGHILIKVLAAGINRLEHYIREGSVVPKLSFPHILGADAAGEVAELGEGVTGFEVGQRVIPMPGFPLEAEEYDIRPALTAPSFTLPGLGIPGTYAQYIEIPAQWIVKDDTGLKPEEVAATVRNDADGEFARSLGADLVINTSKEDFVERIKEWTGRQSTCSKNQAD